MTDPELFSALTVASICISLLFDPVGSCHGDCTGDRAVDGRDLTVVLANFGEAVVSITQGDVNDDGRVDGADLAIVLATWQCREW